jgi:hypothetical protein
MSAVPAEITIQPTPTEDIELIDDLDELAESSKCSCNAGDDNPY